jgi:hypothetical protein
MDAEAELHSPQPDQVNARHIQESRIALARFLADQRHGGGPDSAEAIVESLRIDNESVADYVQETILKIDDPEVKRLIASTAWVVYEATTIDLNPKRK